jgi:hypothetical protein
MRLILSYIHLYLLLAITSSCTLCFQNISVHGNATDMADDTQTNTPKVDTTANFSAMPNIPGIPPKFPLNLNGPAAPVGTK